MFRGVGNCLTADTKPGFVLKLHLEGLDFNPAPSSRSNAFLRCPKCSSRFSEKISISSMHTETKSGPSVGLTPITLAALIFGTQKERWRARKPSPEILRDLVAL